MFQGRLKHIVTGFFLVLFLSVKIAGLHVLSHCDDKDNLVHCAVCDLTTAQNMLPAIAPDLPDFTVGPFEETGLCPSNKEYVFMGNGTLGSDQLFSRPPPSTL